MNITPFTSGQLWDLFVGAKVDLLASRVKTYCPDSSLQLTTMQPFPSEDSGERREPPRGHQPTERSISPTKGLPRTECV